MSKDAVENTEDTEALPPHYGWNFGAFMVDFVGFGVAFNFVSLTSVLPAFVRRLTDSAPLVGLVSTTFRGGWLLPQLAVAHLIKDKPRKKPYMVAGTSGRVLWWVVALALWAGLAHHPSAMLALFFACLALWAITDAVVSLAWFDIIARAIPLKQRGRLVGIAQFVSGTAGVGVGALVGLILERRPFPDNFALIFTLAGVFLTLAATALALIREPPVQDMDSSTSKQAQDGWLTALSKHRAFRHLILCRMMIGLMDLASPFYVGHAEEALHLPQSIIGGFVAAQTTAGMIASLLLGLISERWGPRQVIRIGSAAAAIGPAFALAAHLSGGWMTQAYPFVYVTLGVVNSIWMLGFTNYMLEIVPEGARPVYIGLGNTIMGILTLAPTAGGWLLEATSYTTLFGLTTVLVALGFLLTLRLKPPQQAKPA